MHLQNQKVATNSLHERFTQDSMYINRIQTKIITCSRFVTKNSTVESRHSNRPPNVSSNAHGRATSSNETCLKREIKQPVTFLMKLSFFTYNKPAYIQE